MDTDDELLPEDDSVFEALVEEDDPVNDSDMLLDDSFSSIPDVVSSTPIRERPGPTARSSRARSRAASPAIRPDSTADSPSRNTRAQARAATPTPGSVADPAVNSPSRSTRARARAATPTPGSVADPAVNSPSRSTRARARAATPTPGSGADPAVNSPSRSTRARARAATPTPGSVADPAVNSPSRNTRARARAATPTPVSGADRSTNSPSRNISAAVPTPVPAVVSSSRNVSRRAAPPTVSRIKCRECPSTLANERTFKIHKQMHSMKRMFSRIAKLEKLQEDFFSLAVKTLEKLLEEKFVGQWAEALKAYVQQVRDTFNNVEQEHQDLSNFLCEDLYLILSSHSSVFSSSLVYSFYIGVNRLLNNREFVQNLKKHIVVLGEVQVPETAVLNLFIGNFMHVFSSEIVLYFIRTIHGATTSDIIRRKRSKDKIDSKEFLEMCYYIGGSVVRTFNQKGNKYKENNKHWMLFSNVLTVKFIRSPGVANACTEAASHFTDKVDRGKLTHISQEALDFFLVLFDFLMSLEGEDGSLPVNVVETVMENDTIILLWDILVGSELEEDVSIDFLMQMTETCKRVVAKGIMKRRLNENIQKAIAAVPLRSRLAD